MIDAGDIPMAEARVHQLVFKKSLSMKIRLHEVIRSVGDTGEQTCLDIGSESGMMSRGLRSLGGQWHTLVLNKAIGENVKAAVKDNVHVLESHNLPFENKTFDLIVIVGSLESVSSDGFFIEECHRALKADGRLVINVGHVKPWSLIGFVRRALGLGHDKLGLARSGYSESELFRILKNGFDVANMRSYLRFFIRLTDTIVEFAAMRIRRQADSVERRIVRLYTIAGIVYRLAFQLDGLLFFTRGHYLLATAKRRAWLPRNAPVLVDGRSISEAVLKKAVD